MNPSIRPSAVNLALAILAGAALLFSGCTNEPDATCVLCQSAMTTAECARIATAAGCGRSETYTATTCSTGSQIGCRFYECGSGNPMCGAAVNDAGARD